MSVDFNHTIILPLEEHHIPPIIEWTYSPPYDIYNLDNNQETKDNFYRSPYFVCIDLLTDQIIGYYCVGQEATIPIPPLIPVYDEHYLDIGLGLRPDLTGQGLGEPFLKKGLNYLENHYGTTNFRLTVYEHNERAVKLYLRVGFRVIHRLYLPITKTFILIMIIDKKY